MKNIEKIPTETLTKLQEDFMNTLTDKNHPYRMVDAVTFEIRRQNGENHFLFNVNDHLSKLSENEKNHILNQFQDQNNTVNSALTELAYQHFFEPKKKLTYELLNAVVTNTVIEKLNDTVVNKLSNNEFGKADLAKQFELYCETVRLDVLNNTLPEPLKDIGLTNEIMEDLTKTKVEDWFDSINDNLNINVQNLYLDNTVLIMQALQNHTVQLLDCSPYNINNEMGNVDDLMGENIKILLENQSGQSYKDLSDEQKLTLLEEIDSLSDNFDNPVVRILSQNGINFSNLISTSNEQNNVDLLNEVSTIASLQAGKNSTIAYEVQMNVVEQTMLNVLRELSKVKHDYQELPPHMHFNTKFLNSDLLNKGFKMELQSGNHVIIPITSLYAENKEFLNNETSQLQVILDREYIHVLNNEEKTPMFIFAKQMVDVPKEFLDVNHQATFYDVKFQDLQQNSKIQFKTINLLTP